MATPAALRPLLLLSILSLPLALGGCSDLPDDPAPTEPVGESPTPYPEDPTPTEASTPTATEAASPTATEAASPTATEATTPTATEDPTPTATEAASPTATEATTPTATEAPTPTATEAASPTATEAPTPTATVAPTPTAIPTPSPTPTVAPTPTAPTDGDGDGEPAATDCDDGDPAVNSGASEVCDGIDNDCDGQVDDFDDDVLGAPTWRPDFDADGYGSASAPTLTQCAQPTGYAQTGGDCDDSDAAYNPGAPEADCADPNDYNCDGAVGYADGDGDGYAACEDCDDGDAGTSPSASETCDGGDDDCDGAVDEEAVDLGTYYADGDGDGYGDAGQPVLGCALPEGAAASAGDCDDGDADVHPGSAEVCGGVDDDCDGVTDEGATDAPTWYLDADEDGYGRGAGAQTQCLAPTGLHVTQGGDCADLNPAVNPGQTEVCNGTDDDCDGLTDDGDDGLDLDTATAAWADGDGDGWGDPAGEGAFCVRPEGYVSRAEDCDDDTASVNPEAEEICDGLDNDCDGEADDGAFGEDALCAGASCFDIKVQRPGAPDGVYYISPEGGAPFQVACDMTTDGGGWTVLEKSPYGDAVGAALYRDLPVNQGNPANAKHRLSRARMNALQAQGGDLRIDCRGEDYLVASTADLFAGEGGPNTCNNWAVIAYREARLKGNTLYNREIVTWMVGRSEGCAGAWHIDEFAQQSYAFRPNFPWTGSAITSSSADTFATDPNSVDGQGHECHVAGAVRHVMVRPAEICGDGTDDDGDGAIDEGTLGLVAEDAGASCQAILAACPSGRAADGIYHIDPDGAGAMEAYCDMHTDGGGWTMVGSFNNTDGDYGWTKYASGDNNLGVWRDDSTFGDLASFEDADTKTAAFSRLAGTDLLARDSTGGWASYRGALAGSLLDTIDDYTTCQTAPLAGVEVRSSDAVVNDYGILSFYGGDPNNADRCAFNFQEDITDSSVIAMAHQGCGTAGFGHLGWKEGSGFHNDRDHYFCLASSSVLNNSSGSCGAWKGYVSNNWFDSVPCAYALLFVR